MVFKVGARVRVTENFQGARRGLIDKVGTVTDVNEDNLYPYEVAFDEEPGSGIDVYAFFENELEYVGVQVVTEDPSLMPEYKSPGAAGADLKSAEELDIEPGQRVTVRTGVKMLIPSRLYGKIEDRSGLAAKYGLITHAGVVDPDYTGEVRVVLENTGIERVKVRRGDRIAQIVFQPFEQVTFNVVDELPETDRGEGGFGSTGI